MDWLYVLFGLFLLVAGGDGLVRGASGLALLARVTPAVVGLTIVAAGTSTPELVVSLQSAAAGNVGLALGNVVGSNIFNIGAILALAAIVRPLAVLGSAVRLEWPVMMLASLQLYLMSRDALVDRVEGAFLVTALVAFTGYAVWIGRNTESGSPDSAEDVATASFGAQGVKAVLFNVLAVILGVALLAAGSTLLVEGAVNIAQAFGISDTVVGLTIVAAGTSTPELVTSLVASRRGRDDIAIANVLGSNIFNVLGILGVTAVVMPLSVPSVLLERDVWWMLGLSALLFPLMRSGMRVTRLEGVVLLGLFLAYMGTLIASTT